MSTTAAADRGRLHHPVNPQILLLVLCPAIKFDKADHVSCCKRADWCRLPACVIYGTAHSVKLAKNPDFTMGLLEQSACRRRLGNWPSAPNASSLNARAKSTIVGVSLEARRGGRRSRRNKYGDICEKEDSRHPIWCRP